MDTITYFKYALGGIEDIKKGNFDNMQIMDSLNDREIAKVMYNILNPSSEKIIIPQFIGVYQDWKLKTDTIEEKEHKAEIEKEARKFENNRNLILSDFCGGRIKDKLHPDLIHLCYDSNIYNNSLLKELFEDKINRLGFSPYDNYPNFEEKNTSLVEIYSEKINETKEKEGKDTPAIKKIAQEGYGQLEKQLKFGLTRDEKVFLEILSELRKSPEERRGFEINLSNLIRFAIDDSASDTL